MALTNAERQARLRTNRKYARPGERKARLDVWIDGEVRTDLEILAAMTRKPIAEVLEGLIASAVTSARKQKAEWSKALDSWDERSKQKLATNAKRRDSLGKALPGNETENQL